MDYYEIGVVVPSCMSTQRYPYARTKLEKVHSTLSRVPRSYELQNNLLKGFYRQRIFTCERRNKILTVLYQKASNFPSTRAGNFNSSEVDQLHNRYYSNYYKRTKLFEA